MQLPGIYVEIKGDYTELEKNLKAAKAIVTSQATSISNAMNNALSPDKIRGGLDALVKQFASLDRASKVSGKSFTGIKTGLEDLRKVAALTEEQWARLQERFLSTQTSGMQEGALKRIATSAGLARGEIRELGKQFSLSDAQIEKVAYSVHGVDKKIRTLADAIRTIPPLKNYLSIPQEGFNDLKKSSVSQMEDFAKNLSQLAVVGEAGEAGLKALDRDMVELARHTGLTSEQIVELKTKVASVTAEKAQEQALRGVASAAGLTRQEIERLGNSMGVQAEGVNRVADALHGAENRAAAFAKRVAALPKISQYTDVSAPATTGLDRTMQGGEQALVRNLVSVAGAAESARRSFALTGEELSQLGSKVGLTGTQLAELKNRIVAVAGEKVRFESFRALAESAGLARDEVVSLAQQMGFSKDRANEAAVAIHGAEAAIKSYGDRIKSLPKLPTLNNLSTGAQADLFKGYSGQYAAMANDLTALRHAESMAGKAADAFSNDMEELGKHAGIADREMQELQNRLSNVSAARAQEQALKRLSEQLNLTEKEMRQMGRNFNIPTESVDRVAKSMSTIGDKGKKSMSAFGGSVAMAAGKFLLLEQAAYSVQRILNAVVFDFNATVETATLGIAAAFLNNGQYVDQITGKVLDGQAAMKAATKDAQGVIEQLRASNLQTVATLDQLIKAYQEAAPVALDKKFDKSQVEQFTVAMMQAAGAIDTTGMLIGQMGEEMRSLLNGGINPKNTRIATALGITNQEVARYKGDVQGLFDFLMGKLAAYQAFGEQLQHTWTGVASNMLDVLKQGSAQATEPLFIAIRDGLYDWQQGIAKIVEKTDELGNKTRVLEWSPGYLKSVESVKDILEDTIDLVRSNKDVIGAMFEVAGSAAIQSLDGINQALVLIGNVVSTAKAAIAEMKELAGVEIDIPKPWDIPGAMINGLRGVNQSWSGYNDEKSGKRDKGGNLMNASESETAIDRIQQRIKALKQELSVAKNSISSMVFGDRSPEVIGKDLKALEAQLKSIQDRSSDGGANVKWEAGTKNSADDLEHLDKILDDMGKLADKNKSATEEYVRTAKESAVAKFDEMTKYVPKDSELYLKAEVKLKQELAEIDERSAKSGRTGALNGERSALKELNAEIAGYTAEAREAADAGTEWHRSALDALSGIERLNDEIATSTMGDFGRIAYESARKLKEGADEVDAYQKSLSAAAGKVSTVAAAYEQANARLSEAKAALGGNSAGSDTQDANKVRALEQEVGELDKTLKLVTTDYANLTDAQKQAITTLEQLKAAVGDVTAYETNMQAYQELGLVSQDFYSKLERLAEQEKRDFIANGGDKELADRLFFERALERRKALAAQEYNRDGSVSGLMGVGVDQGALDTNHEAIDFYSNLLPSAIGESSDALSQFFRDVAQGNASMSDSWQALGKTIENVVFDIMQDLTSLSIKMAVMGFAQTMIGSVMGGVTGGSATGAGYSVPGVTPGFHSGGTIGKDAPTFTRSVPLSIFGGAPRFHQGLKGNEFPAILERGESVLTEGQMKAIGRGLSSSGSGEVVVNIIESSDKGGEVEQSKGGNGQNVIDIFVERVKAAVASDIANGNGAVPSTMQSVYGLNRTAGGY